MINSQAQYHGRRYTDTHQERQSPLAREFRLYMDFDILTGPLSA